MSVKLRYVAGGPRIRLRAVPGIQGIQGIPGQVQDIEAGQGIAIDLSDPVHPKISVDAVAAEIPFTPTGQVGSTDVQAAIAELDSKKLSVLDAASNYQPLNTDLTTIAGQDNETFGLDLLTMDTAEAVKDRLRDFKTVSLLLADTDLTYSAGVNQVAAGDRVTAQGYRYVVAATDATDHHIETAGGVKLYVLAQSGHFYDAAFGVLGAGADETVAFQKACTVAAAAKKPLVMTGLAVLASAITVTQDLTILGSGSLTKLAGTSGGLLFANNASLKIHGSITIDQNKDNTGAGGGAPGQDNYAIRCNGERLWLSGGVRLPPSRGPNIYATPSKSLTLHDVEAWGGHLCVYAPPPSTCNVRITGGKYYSSSAYDNIQVLNAQSVVIDGIETFDAAWSGIVVGNAVENCRIVNCYAHDNHINVPSNQGGWGIVTSVGTSHSVVANNVCRGNQRGGITIDTYTSEDPSYTEAYFSVVGNVVDGNGDLNPSGYAATGISINGARNGSVSGNFIRRSTQGLHTSDPKNLTVSGNTIQEIGDSASGYFAQIFNGANTLIEGNVFSGAGGIGSSGMLNISGSPNVGVKDNLFTDIAGARPLIRITNSAGFVIGGNVLRRSATGDSYMIWFAGVCTDGAVVDNEFICDAASYQYYIVATGSTVTGSITRNNRIKCTGIQTNPNRYILNGSGMFADGDVINGVKDYFSAAPSMFTPLTGAVAVIAGALKMYNGSSWV